MNEKKLRRVNPRKRALNPHKGKTINGRKITAMYKALFPKTGDRMWALRSGMNMSQKEIGEACGLSASVFGRIEAGYGLPKGTSLVKIGEGIGVSADFLLNLSDKKEIS